MGDAHFIKGDAHFVQQLLLEEMELAIWVQILEKNVCISRCADRFWKGMSPFVFTPAIGNY